MDTFLLGHHPGINHENVCFQICKFQKGGGH
uniref:Uncharacterized protein n=1 Tax=Arundo donax TaxID=35708 RepID=A0A0A9BSS1_ARUDO